MSNITSLIKRKHLPLQNSNGRNRGSGDHRIDILDDHFNRDDKKVTDSQKDRIFLVAFVGIDIVSAVLDQLEYAMFGMVLAYVSLIGCIYEIVSEGRKKGAQWRWGYRVIPWFYYSTSSGMYKPLCTFYKILGLVFSMVQGFSATVAYVCYIRNVNNPINMSLYTLVFGICLLFRQFKLMKVENCPNIQLALNIPEKLEIDFTQMLPESCLSLIISFTSPLDACQAAQVCHALRSAANSDAVWERFLPRYYEEIFSRSSLSLLSLPKKDLYLHLCSHPILITNEKGPMSLQLEKRTGKKCYMLGAKSLSITHGDTPENWTWPSHPVSRFSKVAESKEVWWLNVKGRIDRRILSSETNYAAYLVFMLDINRKGFRDRTVGLNVGKAVRNVLLDPPEDVPQVTRERGDGWMEIKMGEFFIKCGDDGRVKFCLREVNTNYCKKGLIIEGIEVRPKDMICG